VELVKRARLSSTDTLSLRWKKGGKIVFKKIEKRQGNYIVTYLGIMNPSLE
jgi:hypothetical protein